MAKTIQEQITEMEIRCQKLEKLEKLFNKAVKNEFGIESKRIHKILNNDGFSIDFFEKIGSYFNLKTEQDFSNFLSIFCNDSSKRYYQKKLEERSNRQEIETASSVS